MKRKTGESEVSITVRVSKDVAANLKRLAWRESLFKMQPVSVSGLVRAAIEQAYGGRQPGGEQQADGTAAGPTELPPTPPAA